MKNQGGRSRPLAVLVAGALAAWAAVPAAQAQTPAPLQQQALVDFNIPGQPLDQALQAFAVQSRHQVLFSETVVAGRQAPALQGRLAPRAALERLLAGAGIEINSARAGVFTLTPATALQGAGTTLGMVLVTAQAERTTKTEGTGSYAAQASAAATGLALSARETPQSLSVLTRQQMDDQNVQSLGDALQNVTGVVSTSSPSDNRAYYYARGFQITRMQYDGVSTAANSNTGSFGENMASDLAFYDRVEVVRGSTALLSGSGEPGASVNLVRKRADSKSFAGSASLGLGSWNDRRAMLDLSAPLVEDGRVRGRVVALAQERDSFVAGAGGNANGLLAVIDADLGAQTRLSLGADYQQGVQRTPIWGGLPLFFSDGTPTDWPVGKIYAPEWAMRDTVNQSAFIDLEHRLSNGWKLKANATRRLTDSEAKLINWYGDVDRVTGAGIEGWQYYSRARSGQTSGSLQASGGFELLGREHEAVLGWMGNRYAARQLDGLHAPLAVMDNIYSFDGRIAEPEFGPLKDWGVDRTSESGFYGALRLSLADSLKLIVGGRQSHWQTTPNGGERRSFEQFTPYAGLILDLGAQHSLYASYTDIFQPQNARTVTGALLDPETGRTSEIGIKGEYLDGRLNASLALFSSQKDNVAVRDGQNLVPGTGGWAYVGAKGVRSKGFELQVAGEIQPGWNVSAGYADSQARNAAGARLSTTNPEKLLQLHTSYRLPGDWQQWTVGGGLNWQDRIYANVVTPAGTREGEQKARAIASLMLRYVHSRELALQLNVGNLFDRKYWAYLDGTGYPGTPRHATLTASYKF